MDHEQDLESLWKEATCSICLEMFREPQTIDCGHNFCRACIVGLWESVVGEVSCPQCRQVFPRQHLRPNRTVSNLTEIIQKLLPMPREEPAQWDKEAEAQNKLAEALDRFEVMLEELSRSRLEEEASVAKLKRRVGGLKMGIRYEFARLHRFLDDEELILATRLRQREENVAAQIQENLRQNTEEVNAITEMSTAVQTKLCSNETGTTAELRDIVVRAKSNQPAKVPVDLTLGDFSGPILYTIWKQMLNVISPVPIGLTLDPRTANPFLEVSDDRTEVRLVKERRDVAENAGRFTACLCVLGAEAFAGGRHYWQVEVGDNSAWIVGVAKGSIERKADITLKPSNGCWAVEHFLWKHQALTSPPTQLQPARKPMRLGVYLDYAAGQVTMCDAEDMSHLYTFTDVFTGRLHPFFWTACKDGCLKMVALHV
ncbi:E3 ubiquitin-protein ligase TRIM39-like [Rhinoraja longicauda]